MARTSGFSSYPLKKNVLALLLALCLLVTGEEGGELLCDAAAGTITSPDWIMMITPEMPLEGEAHSLKDSNGGGSSDVLMLLADLTTGRNYLRGRTRLTGQAMVWTFEADTNFDGVFDEKDRDAGFDFNYGVLTT